MTDRDETGDDTRPVGRRPEAPHPADVGLQYRDIPTSITAPDGAVLRNVHQLSLKYVDEWCEGHGVYAMDGTRPDWRVDLDDDPARRNDKGDIEGMKTPGIKNDVHYAPVPVDSETGSGPLVLEPDMVRSAEIRGRELQESERTEELLLGEVETHIANQDRTQHETEAVRASLDDLRSRENLLPTAGDSLELTRAERLREDLARERRRLEAEAEELQQRAVDEDSKAERLGKATEIAMDQTEKSRSEYEAASKEALSVTGLLRKDGASEVPSPKASESSAGRSEPTTGDAGPPSKGPNPVDSSDGDDRA